MIRFLPPQGVANRHLMVELKAQGRNLYLCRLLEPSAFSDIEKPYLPCRGYLGEAKQV